MRLVLFAMISLLFAPDVCCQYIMLGDARQMPGGCIQLTPDHPYREGIAYSEDKMNLDHYFEIQFDIYLGDKDEYGADGIAFVLHNDERQFEAFGTYGECLGYGRWSRGYLAGNYIAPSIAVEFDTYQNYNQNDPASDHVAYLENGTNFHTDYWNNDDETFNLEDDRLHDFRFRWEPDEKRISVFLDGALVHQSRRDLKQDIFNGETRVIWGFTASTGRKFNLQYFCLKRIAAEPPPENRLTYVPEK